MAIDPSAGLVWQNDMHTEFSSRPSFHNYVPVPYLPSTSLHLEMVNFYANLSTKETQIIRADSFSTIHHILRLMAAEWLNVSHIIECELTQLDYRRENGITGFNSLQQEVNVLHMWRRRCARYGDMLRRSEEICSHRGPMSWPKLDDSESTNMITKDFQAVQDKFKRMETNAEKQISTVFAKISVEAGEESIDEARRVTRLTVIATIFLPMSFVASIFGMSGRFALDGDRWWMYVAVAIPLAVSITLCGLYCRKTPQEKPAWSVHHDHFDTEHLRQAGLSY